MVSVRMMRMKIIGTIVAKLRAARSRCGYADYLPNILKCSAIPGRSLSEKTVKLIYLQICMHCNGKKSNNLKRYVFISVKCETRKMESLIVKLWFKSSPDQISVSLSTR